MTESTAQPLPSSSKTLPPLLIPEAIGFAPQLLLDDVINVANNAVQDAIDGMEGLLQKWADERVGPEDSTQEIEQGLVLFQTLLEYHTDLAFDFFEAWALKNIFACPPDLPMVLPHHEGLDLTTTPEREKELMDEISSLRERLLNERQTQKLLTRAIRVSRQQRLRADKRFERLSALDSPRMDVLARLPPQLLAMHEALTNLPPLGPETIAALTQIPMTEPGKRQWETSKAGYLNWAVNQLLQRSNKSGVSTTVAELSRDVAEVGSAIQMREACEKADLMRNDLRDLEPMEE
ncbi:Mis12-domain-containing protein [Dendrothele bispora CBS 962.96]|uniref:Mis12-domain-containing protein n=1 Tax=Dendrothele bispora (strain CBS 962.96) TaxID=1314807 RepID=A0A4V4HEM4_DENBC|nr:Mis12-domain-containing protein [Dendrothele bispora CBS 962.96]